MNWLIIGIGTIFSALFYWAGGRGRDFSKGFFFKSIVRDLGCSLTFLICGSLIIEWSLISQGLLILSSLILFGSLTTYHKWLNDLFGRKNERLDLLNYGFTGLCYGLSTLPMAFSGFGIGALLLRCLVLSGLVGIFGIIKNAWVSEALRGAAIIATLIILEALK